MIARPNPSKPLIKKIAAGVLEELYMGLQDAETLSMYEAMNLDEFLAFAAGSYQMRIARPVRVEEILVTDPSLVKFVNTALMQYMPNGRFSIEGIQSAVEKITASAAGEYSDQRFHASRLSKLNIYDTGNLDERIQLFEDMRPETTKALFKQFRRQPKLPYVQDMLDSDGLAEVSAHPGKYHKVPYFADTTRDKFKANQTLDDFYAQEIAKTISNVLW